MKLQTNAKITKIMCVFFSWI